MVLGAELRWVFFCVFGSIKFYKCLVKFLYVEPDDFQLNFFVCYDNAMWNFRDLNNLIHTLYCSHNSILSTKSTSTKAMFFLFKHIFFSLLKVSLEGTDHSAMKNTHTYPGVFLRNFYKL